MSWPATSKRSTNFWMARLPLKSEVLWIMTFASCFATYNATPVKIKWRANASAWTLVPRDSRKSQFSSWDHEWNFSQKGASHLGRFGLASRTEFHLSFTRVSSVGSTASSVVAWFTRLKTGYSDTNRPFWNKYPRSTRSGCRRRLRRRRRQTRLKTGHLFKRNKN